MSIFSFKFPKHLPNQLTKLCFPHSFIPATWYLGHLAFKHLQFNNKDSIVWLFYLAMSWFTCQDKLHCTYYWVSGLMSYKTVHSHRSMPFISIKHWFHLIGLILYQHLVKGAYYCRFKDELLWKLTFWIQAKSLFSVKDFWRLWQESSMSCKRILYKHPVVLVCFKNTLK